MLTLHIQRNGMFGPFRSMQNVTRAREEYRKAFQLCPLLHEAYIELLKLGSFNLSILSRNNSLDLIYSECVGDSFDVQ